MKANEAEYKALVLDKLMGNLNNIQGQLTRDTNGDITKSLQNTCLFAKALQYMPFAT